MFDIGERKLKSKTIKGMMIHGFRPLLSWRNSLQLLFIHTFSRDDDSFVGLCMIGWEWIYPTSRKFLSTPRMAPMVKMQSCLQLLVVKTDMEFPSGIC